jgi:hypothetical protein
MKGAIVLHAGVLQQFQNTVEMSHDRQRTNRVLLFCIQRSEDWIQRFRERVRSHLWSEHPVGPGLDVDQSQMSGLHTRRN